MGELTFWPYVSRAKRLEERYLDAELEGHPLLFPHDPERVARFAKAQEEYDWDRIPKSRFQAWRQRQLEEIVTEVTNITRPLCQGAQLYAQRLGRFADYATQMRNLKNTSMFMLAGGIAGGMYGALQPFTSQPDTYKGFACGVLAGMGGSLLKMFFDYRQERKYREMRD